MTTIKIKNTFNFNALYSNKTLIHTSQKKVKETEVSPWKRFKYFPLKLR